MIRFLKAWALLMGILIGIGGGLAFWLVVGAVLFERVHPVAAIAWVFLSITAAFAAAITDMEGLTR